MDQNPREILASHRAMCGLNFPLTLWENIMSFNCINAQILVYTEGIEKGSFSLGKFDNERKWEGFDAFCFLNPRRALYKWVECSGLTHICINGFYTKAIVGVFLSVRE